MKLELSKLNFSLSQSHPNKMQITGSITKVGTPSDGIPCGSDKRVIFTSEAASKCHESFRSMPVNCTFPDWLFGEGTEVFTGHGDINIGVIEDTWIEGSDMMAKITVWKNVFPDIGFMICNGKDALGFSIEAYPDKTHEDDAEDGFLYIDEFTGVGCALLWKNVAAFKGTFIRELAAKRKVDDKVDEKKLQELLDGMLVKVEAKITEVQASVAELKESFTASEAQIAEIKASVDTANEETKATIEEIKASADVIKASTVIPAPTATQTVVPNLDVVTKNTKAERIAEINASTDIDMMAKIKKIVKIQSEREQAAE